MCEANFAALDVSISKIGIPMTDTFTTPRCPRQLPFITLLLTSQPSTDNNFPGISR